jgi:multiple sugar transport system ATP-binding protein
VADKDGVVLSDGSFDLRPASFQAEVLQNYRDKTVYFGIRPEDLRYSENPEPNSIPAKITVVEPLGADIHLWLNAGTQPIVARTDPQHVFKVGDTVTLVPDMEKARFFDRDTELSLLT